MYQTKWAKFGLAALGLDDPLTVPRRKDSYAALFWWSDKKDDVADQPLLESDNYPYLTWAASHYAGKTVGKLSDRDYPLTWEAHASQANYDGMRWVAAEYVQAKTCAPHTWHAAEAFLYLCEEKEETTGASGDLLCGTFASGQESALLFSVRLSKMNGCDAE